MLDSEHFQQQARKQQETSSQPPGTELTSPFPSDDSACGRIAAHKATQGPLCLAALNNKTIPTNKVSTASNSLFSTSSISSRASLTLLNKPLRLYNLRYQRLNQPVECLLEVSQPIKDLQPTTESTHPFPSNDSVYARVVAIQPEPVATQASQPSPDHNVMTSSKRYFEEASGQQRRGSWDDPLACFFPQSMSLLRLDDNDNTSRLIILPIDPDALEMEPIGLLDSHK